MPLSFDYPVHRLTTSPHAGDRKSTVEDSGKRFLLFLNNMSQGREKDPRSTSGHQNTSLVFPVDHCKTSRPTPQARAQSPRTVYDLQAHIHRSQIPPCPEDLFFSFQDTRQGWLLLRQRNKRRPPFHGSELSASRTDR